MKSKILKFVLPAFAILLAVSLSFATVNNAPSQTGYYDDPFIPGVQSIALKWEREIFVRLVFINSTILLT